MLYLLEELEIEENIVSSVGPFVTVFEPQPHESVGVSTGKN